ncbi:MAG: radical SAM protein [Lentisphaerae bacterium]|nr:radical SAM protein [Lentisphaerota bacterium]MBT4820186.1 radical SAM protein [Lentisphaerota bacterium]MBT5610016.1 radical SAM protein [Lentisphaerota bacterium]MBT7059139.1 radical SAM protein [Lentisphaerota bacterium]MBT7841461.1 radical SAM protein [Lentisphaerota bacterium]
MYDRFARHIHYLRVSVTDRCNLRCTYCMPEQGVPLISHDDVLSFEEIRDVVCAAVDHGFDKIRLTGGEPLVRRGIVNLVEMLARIRGIRDLAMSTNGTLLAEHAEALAEAGLQRVNVSLDAMCPTRFATATRGGCLEDVLSGIRAAREAGLTPVKLNCVVRESSLEPDAKAVAAFAAEEGLEVRYIRQMDFSRGEFWPISGGTGGDCELCTRLRLTSNGQLLPCLFSDLAFDVRKLGPAAAIEAAVDAKPERGGPCENNRFYRIGG